MRKKGSHHPDCVLVSSILLLVLFGLVMLSSASSDLGKIKFDDTYYYIKHQVIYGLGLGIAGFLFAFFLHYRYWQKFAVPILLVSLVSLVLVFTPIGLSHSGATRWLNLGSLSVQPAEFLKFSFIIYLAAWLSNINGPSRQKNFLRGYLPFLLILGLIAFLVLIQPSTTTVAIVMISSLAVYFVSGARLSFIFGTILLVTIAFTLLISFSNDYRLQRIQTFIKNIFQEE